MKPSKQDFFNQFRENTIIEVIQILAKSEAGSNIAFKGGTALKLFHNLPRYSEDIDYDSLLKTSPQKLMEIIKSAIAKRRWEITDDAVKYHTVLLELRFAGPERNFRVKIEISTREKELKTTIESLRGVPVLTLEPSFLMTEKLITFVERQAGRDIFDAWFILNNAYALDEPMIIKNFGDNKRFFRVILGVINNIESTKMLRDTGKLLSLDHRNWIKTSFLSDFDRLVRNKIKALN
ncbi:MAG: nucleotidyl transferase AbiEii/AbiGii toxin family protein [Desulfobacteraceae bacterium]|jgi:predicted nucleotidyltransferase component of viral defense system